MKKLLLASAVAASFVSTAAYADTRINGFANFTAGVALDENEVYGYDEDIDFNQHSLFAIQLSSDINDKVSATGQIIARGSNDFDAKFEWAYLTYKASDNLSVSAGRLRAPLFLYSESLDVGYSYHWVDAPQTVYDIVFNNLDGIRLDYNTYAGDWELGAQFAFGVIDNPDIGPASDGSANAFKGNNTIIVTLNAGYESFKGRVVYGQTSASGSFADVDTLLATLEQISPSFADQVEVDDDTGQFFGVALSYDNFDWFVNAEYTLVQNEDVFFQDDAAYYVSAGTRMGKLTPSITYQRRDGEDGYHYTDQIAALPAAFQAALGPVIVGLEESQFEDYSMVSLGLRYDWNTQIALKGEIVAFEDRLDGDNDTTMFRLAVNYVF
ncbi:topoisomerase IV [Glaciecola sp. 2405UD65-10]|uniref:topoisomerase IV n=1 Tax=Glaciecola sp. 2405UD65-10 TaxID=3397244 RepID=UPI003B5AD471